MSSAAFFSLSLPVGYGVPPRELVQLIVQADRVGLAGVAVGELTSTDAMVLLAAAAPLTETIRLETAVLSVLTRSPAMFAMGAATLADLSNHRFVLGIGAGSPIGAGFHGEAFERPVERVERWIRDIRTALDGRPLADWGAFRLRGVASVPVPILVAAMNPRTIRVAGELGDGVILNFCGPDQVRDLGALAQAARRERGIVAPFEIHNNLWGDATGDPERAYRQFKAEMAPYLAVPTYRSAVVALSDADAIDRAAAAWESKGRTAAAELFPDSIAHAMVASGPGDLAAKASGFRAAGCSGVRVTALSYDKGDRTHASRVVDMLAEAEALLDQD